MIRENYKVFLLWCVASIIYGTQIFLMFAMIDGVRCDGGSRAIEPKSFWCGPSDFGATFPSILYWLFPLIFLASVFYYLNKNNKKMAISSAVAIAPAPVIATYSQIGFKIFAGWYANNF